MPATSSQKSRKIKALLAGGLVLGVGAAVTLAAWTDQEWATGTFQAGTFDIEGSINGTDWAQHETAGTAAALSFQVNADNLTPGDTVADAFVVRTSAGTTYDANVALIAADSTGANAANISYQIFTVPATTDCTATASAAAGTSIAAPGTAFNASPVQATDFTLQSGLDAAAGTPTVLCFQVTAGAGLLEGEQASATWGLEATSVDS